jgi:hypothetical protein
VLSYKKVILYIGGVLVCHKYNMKLLYQYMGHFILIWVLEIIMGLIMGIMLLGWICIIKILVS